MLFNWTSYKKQCWFFYEINSKWKFKFRWKKYSKFFWVYRDYSINDTNKYLDKINSQAKNCENYNKYFKNQIKIFTLPSSMIEDKNFNNPNAKMEVIIDKEGVDQIANNIINQLKNKLKEKNENINDIFNKCKNSYDILCDNILNIFNEKYPQNEYFIEKINEIINIYGKELIENYM